MIRKTLILLLTILALGTAVAWIGSLVAPPSATGDWTLWSGPGSKSCLMIHNGWIGISGYADASSPVKPVDWDFAGFAYCQAPVLPGSDRGRILRDVPPRRVALVVVPLWFPFVIFSAYPVIAFIRGPLRRHQRRRKGLCVKCGYDLAGNVSGVCPECGAETSDERVAWRSNMDAELKGVLDRADELLADFVDELERTDAHSQGVTERAKNIFHEVLVKLRSALDMAMNRAWDRHAAPSIPEADREKKQRKVYFPIHDKQLNLDSFLKDIGFAPNLKQINRPLYDILMQAQPFKTGQTRQRQDLLILGELSNLGKHRGLSPQGGRTLKLWRATRKDGSCLFTSERPDEVAGVNVERGEFHWFTVEGYGIHPVVFCASLCQGIRPYLEELTSRI